MHIQFMQINHFLPFFLCSVNLIFNNLFCNSSLPQQVYSASHSSVILLFFCSPCHSALFLLYLSFHSIHLLKFHARHFLLSPFLLSRSFSIQNSQPNTVSLNFFYTLYLDGSTSPSNGNPRTSVLATETLTNLSLSVCLS
jgi:hypothetical protein